MPRGFAVPIVSGRGAGLGNELLVWGKAYIAAKTLNLTPLHPAFGLNIRGYARYFKTPRTDWIQHRVLRGALPSVVFTELDYRARASMPFSDAILDFAVERNLNGRRPLVFGVEGMWGGYTLIEPARDFLHSKLLASRWTLENLYALESKVPSNTLTVGFHIRRGDFGVTLGKSEYQGRSNVAIPLEWYVNIARHLRKRFGDQATFIVVSDAPRAELAPFGTDIPAVFTDERDHRDVSDLLALSKCDLIVCSISSYSLWATFFSRGRYVWLAPNLTRSGGLGSIWGHEAAQQLPGGATARAVDAIRLDIAAGHSPNGRGVAVDWDGVLPELLLQDLELMLAMHRPESDLLYYGAVSMTNSQPSDDDD